MTHPADVEAAWQALATTHTDHLSDESRQLAAAIEGDGYKVTVLDGSIYVDAVLAADPDTGVTDCAASWRVEQVG